MESFLATVDKVYPTNTEFLDKPEKDKIPIYSASPKFSDKDARMYGAISFLTETGVQTDYAYPFDKNNFTFPIKGETVVVFKIANQTFWMPYTNTPYSNYRRDYITFTATEADSVTEVGGSKSAEDLRNTTNAGGTNTNASATKPDDKKKYKQNENIKFIKPKEGDTILSGRVGNTIRFSEFHLTEDGKTSSPSIFIRNKQNLELNSKPVGTLVDEDINKDGTSIYITSNKVKIPFKETIKKEKKAFKDFPASDKLKGDQLFINSDRILLSAKASEFIIYGKGNTGVITDGQYSIDAEKDVYVHTNKNVTIHSSGANQIFFNSENGKIFLGKDKGVGDAGADVQKMVLGGELVQIMSDLIDAINQQIYATPTGPTATGPVNAAAFSAIKSKLKTILSARNYLSK